MCLNRAEVHAAIVIATGVFAQDVDVISPRCFSARRDGWLDGWRAVLIVSLPRSFSFHHRVPLSLTASLAASKRSPFALALISSYQLCSLFLSLSWPLFRCEFPSTRAGRTHARSQACTKSPLFFSVFTGAFSFVLLNGAGRPPGWAPTFWRAVFTLLSDAYYICGS